MKCLNLETGDIDGPREVGQTSQSMNAQMELKSESYHVNHQDIKGMAEPMDKHSPYPTYYEYMADLLGFLFRSPAYPHYIYPAQPRHAGRLCSPQFYIQSKDSYSAKFEAWRLLFRPTTLLSIECGEVQEVAQRLSAEKPFLERGSPTANSLAVSVTLNIKGLQLDSTDSEKKNDRILQNSQASFEACNSCPSHLQVSMSQHFTKHGQSKMDDQALSMEEPLLPVMSAGAFLTSACVKIVGPENQLFSCAGSEEDTEDRSVGIIHPVSQSKIIRQSQVDSFQDLDGNHLLIADFEWSRYLDLLGFRTPAMSALYALNKGRSSSVTQFHVITSSQSRNISHILASPAG